MQNKKKLKYRLIVESEFFNCDVLLNKITIKYLKSIKTYNQPSIKTRHFIPKRIKITIINL